MGKQYDWGKAGKLRAMRDYLGVKQFEMARLIGVAERSYKRMESGTDPVPATLWKDIATLHDKQDREVQDMVYAAHNNDPVRDHASWDDSRWLRTVLARAMRHAPQIEPTLPGDAAAAKEMR